MIRYVTLARWHRLHGQRLVPPPWRPPTAPTLRVAGEDPDPAFTDWMQKVASYLDGLDRETQRQFSRLGHPVRLLKTLAAKAKDYWFRPDDLQRLVSARGQTRDQLDKIVDILATNLAISNQYLDVVLEHSDRAQSPAAKKALEAILDLTHADEAVA
jgi:hypothetical protein